MASVYRTHSSLTNFTIDQGWSGSLKLGNTSEDEIIKEVKAKGFQTVFHNMVWLTRILIRPWYEDLVMIFETDEQDEMERIQVLEKETQVEKTFNEARRALGLTGALEFGNVSATRST